MEGIHNKNRLKKGAECTKWPPTATIFDSWQNFHLCPLRKLWKHWLFFQHLPFMHVYLAQLRLWTVLAGTLSAASVSVSFRFVEAESPNESRLCCFFLPRGWRLTCHTGWTTLAPMIKGVSTTMTKTPPSARATPVLTDTEPMSTTTTINYHRRLWTVQGFSCLSQSPAFSFRDHSLCRQLHGRYKTN